MDRLWLSALFHELKQPTTTTSIQNSTRCIKIKPWASLPKPCQNRITKCKFCHWKNNIKRQSTHQTIGLREDDSIPPCIEVWIFLWTGFCDYLGRGGVGQTLLWHCSLEKLELMLSYWICACMNGTYLRKIKVSPWIVIHSPLSNASSCWRTGIFSRIRPYIFLIGNVYNLVEKG